MSSFNDSSELLDDEPYCIPIVETVDSDDEEDTQEVPFEDMFAFQDRQSERPEKKPPRDYKALDDCIDHAYEAECLSIEKFIRGRKKPKKQKSKHLKPATMVRFKAKLGKGKPIELLALLDSGGAGTLVTAKAAKKLRVRKSNLKPTKWSTPAGEVSTRKTVKTQMTLPEFHHDRVIEWDFHVAESLGMYDMIIGRDLLKFLGIDIRFSKMRQQHGITLSSLLRIWLRIVLASMLKKPNTYKKPTNVSRRFWKLNMKPQT